MELSDDNLPVSEAAKLARSKVTWPTSLKTADIRELDQDFIRQANFSARTIQESVLDLYKDLLGEIIAPATETRESRKTEENPEGKTTVGPSVAKARETIQKHFDDIGYVPEAGTEGTIFDLSSFTRVMLKLTTDLAVNFGAGRFLRNNDPLVVDAYPGLSFERTRIPKGGVDAERDWAQRWLAAAASAGDDDAARVYRETGEMIALKSSGIWQALGDGAGGYDDTLGNPYDPIAFNTHMRMFQAARGKMEKLGFLDEGEKAKPAALDLASLFSGDEIKNRIAGKVTISNSGPADEARDKDGKWSAASDAAYAKTLSAHSADDHRKAADAHEVAAKARRDAAAESTDEKDKAFHLRSAARHDEVAANHRDAAKTKDEIAEMSAKLDRTKRRTNLLRAGMREH